MGLFTQVIMGEIGVNNLYIYNCLEKMNDCLTRQGSDGKSQQVNVTYGIYKYYWK